MIFGVIVILNMKETVREIKQYQVKYILIKKTILKYIINNLKNSMPFKDINEERVMHSKSDNIEIMINNKVDEVIEELSQSLLSRY